MSLRTIVVVCVVLAGTIFGEIHHYGLMFACGAALFAFIAGDILQSLSKLEKKS